MDGVENDHAFRHFGCIALELSAIRVASPDLERRCLRFPAGTRIAALGRSLPALDDRLRYACCHRYLFSSTICLRSSRISTIGCLLTFIEPSVFRSTRMLNEA